MQAPFLIIILVLFAFAEDVWCRQHALSSKSNNEDKIVGGYEDTVQNNPYIVSIQFQDANQLSYQCGGSIISENYILTAAHCTQRYTYYFINISEITFRKNNNFRYGKSDHQSSQANRGGQQYTSAQIIPHPSYNSKNWDNDVAVIRKTTPIKLDGINTKVVKLAEQESDVKSGTNIKASGWGATKLNGHTIPNLMSVVVQAVSRDACSKRLSRNITPNQVCAGVPEGGKGVCQGDSGGPAVVSDSPRSEYTPTTYSARIGEQVGIVSFGYGCAEPGLPAVYTRVSCTGVRSWIKRTTGV